MRPDGWPHVRDAPLPRRAVMCRRRAFRPGRARAPLADPSQPAASDAVSRNMLDIHRSESRCVFLSVSKKPPQAWLSRHGYCCLWLVAVGWWWLSLLHLLC